MVVYLLIGEVFSFDKQLHVESVIKHLLSPPADGDISRRCRYVEIRRYLLYTHFAIEQR
jgi:hypothetical protein